VPVVFHQFLAVLCPGDNDIIWQVLNFGVKSSTADFVFGSQTFLEVKNGVFGGWKWWSWWWRWWENFEKTSGKSTWMVDGVSSGVVPFWTMDSESSSVTVGNDFNSFFELFVFEGDFSAISSVSSVETWFVVVQPFHIRLFESVFMTWNNVNLKLNVHLSVFNVELIFQAWSFELNWVETVNTQAASRFTAWAFDSVSGNVVVGQTSNDQASLVTLVNDFVVIADVVNSEFGSVTFQSARFVPFDFGNVLSDSDSHEAV
jgi:hypothetical protein